jgi:hypothetical protein
LRRIFKGNPNFGSEFLADDVRLHLVGKQVAVGIEDVMRLSDSGPDLGFPTFTLSKIISDGNHLVIQGSGVSKDGADERLHEFCDIFLIKEDKIAEITSYLITSANS